MFIFYVYQVLYELCEWGLPDIQNSEEAIEFGNAKVLKKWIAPVGVPTLQDKICCYYTIQLYMETALLSLLSSYFLHVYNTHISPSEEDLLYE